MGREVDARFTFFVNMGRAVDRCATLLATGGGKGAAQLSAREKLGLPGYLIAAVLNPKVGAGRPGIIRRALREGHEVGLHGGRNHGTWQAGARKWNARRIAREVGYGLTEMQKAIGPLERVRGFASPGWVGPAVSTPASGTGVVPSRRPGGPAPQWWQRRPRRPPVTPQTHPRTDGLDRRGAVVGGRTSGALPPGTFRRDHFASWAASSPSRPQSPHWSTTTVSDRGSRSKPRWVGVNSEPRKTATCLPENGTTSLRSGRSDSTPNGIYGSARSRGLARAASSSPSAAWPCAVRPGVSGQVRHPPAQPLDLPLQGFDLLGEEDCVGGSPAIQVRFSRFWGMVQLGPVRRQEWQIVQSQLDLRDLLP